MAYRRIEPGAGQESVWDYPRPPRLERSSRRVRIQFNGLVLADSRNSYRILETSHPPVYYLPPGDVQMRYLHVTGRRSFCEFKGEAAYYSVQVDDIRVENAAWFYPNPVAAYAALKDFIAFYPSAMELCMLDDEIVQSQAGDFYGGWITSDIVGPFKGGPGTWGW